MPRIVDTSPRPPEIELDLDNASITTARLVAFAITALLISFLVIDRTTVALAAGAGTPSTELKAGSVSLSDDDRGRTLFDLTEMLPGRPLENCIKVDYVGTVFDGVADLHVRGGGDLAPYLDVEILAGQGGSFGDCGGFRTEQTLYVGTLAALVDRHGPDGAAIPAMPIDEARESRTFRVTFTLRDDAMAQGRTAAVDFQWSVNT